MLFTSSRLENRSHLRNCVPFRAGRYGLTKDCVARGESVTNLHKSELDIESGPIGVLDGEDMCALVRALGYAISAECEPL